MNRVFFVNEDVRLEFFKEIKDELQAKSWNDIGKRINTNRSMIDNYRCGKISIPENRFEILLGSLNDNRKAYFSRNIEKREENWGQIIGGKKAYLINKRSFDIGRKIAIKRGKVKYDFDINMPLSEDLCEFIGAIIGDGFTNRYKHLYQTQITGDSRFDFDYYNSRLKLICESLFGITPRIIKKNNCIRLNIYSKRVFEMLTNRFAIPSGVKCYTVQIPVEIVNSEKKLINSTLRGMFDTDGGIGIDKRRSYKVPYIRINYSSVSEKLIRQIEKFLLDYNIKYSIHRKGNTLIVQINGKENVKRFISEIGFSNKRHLDKIRKFL